jgi:hypothetical protein
LPLEREGRIIITFNPTVCETGVLKTGLWFCTGCATDLGENHSRKVAVSYIQRISEAVASIIEAKEESWNYVRPKWM